MSDELNNTKTENTKTTFTNTPNNVQTSDELKADPLYYRQMGTAYSIGKGVKVAVIATGTLLTIGGGTLLAFSLINNTVIKAPEITDVVVKSNSSTTIDYSFKIKSNDNKYDVVFVLTDVTDMGVYSYKANKIDTYEGQIRDLKENTKYNYKIAFTNNSDLYRVVEKGSITTSFSA